VKPGDLLTLLQSVYQDKLALRRRHEAGARLVGRYDFNNTYQYIIAREDTHLGWLRAAIEEMGAAPSDAPGASTPDTPSAEREIISADLEAVRRFIERWRPTIAEVTNARQKLMLTLLLGETVEQQRFLEQALAGRGDLLGPRTSGAETGGSVVAARWTE
jgi:hypothetical protein